jgi:hypothetical protein
MIVTRSSGPNAAWSIITLIRRGCGTCSGSRFQKQVPGRDRWVFQRFADRIGRCIYIVTQCASALHRQESIAISATEWLMATRRRETSELHFSALCELPACRVTSCGVDVGRLVGADNRPLGPVQPTMHRGRRV